MVQEFKMDPVELHLYFTKSLGKPEVTSPSTSSTPRIRLHCFILWRYPHPTSLWWVKGHFNAQLFHFANIHCQRVRSLRLLWILKSGALFVANLVCQDLDSFFSTLCPVTVSSAFTADLNLGSKDMLILCFSFSICLIRLLTVLCIMVEFSPSHISGSIDLPNVSRNNREHVCSKLPNHSQ